jgi:formylmethanofuran dehydrogenase subunit A
VSNFAQIRDYTAWTIHASKAMGVKVVNPGGISAFKFNQRKLDVDENHVHWQVTPRQVLHTLARALRELGVPHPLHIHGSNLGENRVSLGMVLAHRPRIKCFVGDAHSGCIHQGRPLCRPIT